MAAGDDINRAREETQKLTQETTFLIDAFSSLGVTITDAITDAIDSAQGLDKISQKIAKTYERDLTKSVKGIVSSLDTQLDLQRKINKGQDISKEILSIREKSEQNIVALQSRINLLQMNGVGISEELTVELQNQIKLERKILKDLEEQNDERGKSLGLVGKLTGGLNGILKNFDKSGKLSSILDIEGATNQTSRMTDVMSRRLKISSKEISNSKKLGFFIKQIGKNLLSNIKPTDIFTALLVKSSQALKKIDTRVVGLRKNLGLSAGEATNLNDKLAMTAFTSNKIGVNVDTLTKSVNDLNSSLGGTAIIFDEDLLVSATFLRERFNMSEEALGNVTKEALATGRSLESIKNYQLESLVAAEKTLKVNLNTNAALDKANKISGALRLNLEKTPGGLVKAVAQATALGLEVEQTAKMAGKLLDFESSIEAEMQAELLTGKQLNLEQARLLALNGDTAGAAAEIAKQVGSAAEFQAMNVIQQQALADAVGLTADELANSLRTQESISSEADKFTERTAEGAEEAATALSVQQRLAGAAEKLAGILEFSAIAAAVFAGALTGIFFGPIAAIAMAATAGLATAALLGTFQGDDIISPSQGGSGYGKRTLFGPEGAISLNDKDTIVAGTDLKMGDDIVSPPQMGITETITNNNNTETVTNNNNNTESSPTSINIAPLVEQMNKMNATLNAILGKEGTVTLDGTKVGTALTVGSYKLQ